jgi:hypothetical protein
MPEKPGDLVQGTLEMLVLKTLVLEPMCTPERERRAARRNRYGFFRLLNKTCHPGRP